MSAEEVAEIKAAINETRSFLAKATDDPAVFIVNRDGTKQWVQDEVGMQAARVDRIIYNYRGGPEGDGLDANGLPVPVTRSRTHLRQLRTLGPVPPGW